MAIEKQKDGSYIAYNTDEEGLSIIGSGDTVREAKDDFFNSVQETKSACEEAGIVPPAALDEEPTFRFDVSSLFEYYNMINVSAFARYLGINEALLRQYKKGGTYISESQMKRIEDGIHALGHEFTQLRLV